MPIKAPIGCTTNETVTRDLEASQLAALLKGDFEDRGLCEHRQAERLAVLCVSVVDPASHDAALWKAAEALYHFMDTRADAVPLAQREVATRSLYLTMAIQAWSSLRLALEGGFPADRLAQAHADITNHKEQLAARARTRLAVVEGGRDGR